MGVDTFYIEFIGFLGALSVFLAYQIKRPRFALLGMSASGLIWAAHFFLMGQTAGALVAFLAAIRNLCGSILPDKAMQITIPLLLAVTFVLVAHGAQGGIDFLPFIGTSFMGLSSYMRGHGLRFRICLLVGEGFWLSYAVAIGSYALMMSSSVMLVSILISIFRHELLPWWRTTRTTA